MAATMLDRAQAVLREAEADPDRALDRAAALAESARRQGDFAAASIAERAYGVAALHVRDARQAIKHLRTSVDLARRAESPELVGEALRRLAAVLNVAGRPQAALREINTLVSSAHGLERARAQAQRGAILLQLDRLDAAHESLSQALPILRAQDDRMWLKRVLANRGIAQARRFRFAAAQADLVEARRLNEELGIELSVAFLDQNLGWLETLRGDVPRALEYLDRAEDTMRRLGAQIGFLLEDRARLLLATGLLDEARSAAQRSILALEQEGQRIALPDLRLLLATTALLGGDPATAVAQGERAMTSLRRLGRVDAAALARYLTSAGRAAGTGRSSVSLAGLERAADQLDRAGWREASTQAYVLLGELAAERGHRHDAIRHWTLAAGHRRRGPAAQRALAWLAEAELRRLDGRPESALTAVRAGLRLLDRQRAAFGAEELRVSAGRHRVRLSQLGLQMALASARPDRVLTWAEHGRASALTLPPVQPPEDKALAADLAELRVVVLDIEATMRADSSPAKLMARQTGIERRIRERVRRQAVESGDRSPVVSSSQLASRLDDAVLVEFAIDDGQLYAITIDRHRSALRPLGGMSDVEPQIRRLRFALRRVAGSRRVDASMRRLLDDAATRLEEQLLGPIVDRLGDRRLVVVPTAALQGLPWAILPSCRGRAVTVAPSATSWYRATGPGVGSDLDPERVAVVAGPGLPGARDEAVAVSALYATAPILEPESTVARTLDALAEAKLVHLATHGTIHPEHALFSSLTLADGPLTGYDLIRVPEVPGVVVLAGCETARDHVHPGDELLGFASTLIGRGARQVIATVAAVPDAPTAPLMVRFHQHLRLGLPTADALAAAQAELMDGAYAAAVGFVCIGGSDLPPPSG